MRFPRLSVLAVCLILVGAVAGCPGRGDVTTSSKPSGNSASGEASAEDLLKSAVHQLRPENFSIAAATDKPVNLLNSWRTTAADPNSTTEAPKIPAGWIDEADAEQLQRRGYVQADAFHIRDCMLNHTIAAFLAARAADEIGQIRVVFDYVVRNIALRSADEPELPLDVYTAQLFGSGTAEDRAWVCAALLKQLRIDSVIVRPAGEAGAEADAWLLGVLLNGRVYLFDPRMGIAIPSTSDAVPAAGPPATLAEITAHPEWLQSLAIRADQPYAIDAESLKQAEIQPIVEPAFWIARMKHLESALPGDDLCVLYDPLNDESERTGLLSRLRKGSPDWKPEQLKPWAHPRRQSRALRAKLSPAAQQALEIAGSALSIPIPILINGERRTVEQVKEMIARGDKMTVTPGHPEHKMLKIRTDQLLGKFDDATKRYLSIRHLEIEPPVARIQELEFLNHVGAENAFYWTCVCKVEVRDYEAAIEQLSKYLKRYERNGRWNFAARALLAECHAELGHFQEAAAALDRTRSDDPYRAANAIRIKRWTAKQ